MNRNAIHRILIALILVLSPNLALAYDIFMATPSNNSIYAKTSPVAVSGAIIWIVDPVNMIMQPRPTACTAYLVNRTTGVIEDSKNATIANISNPNPPDNIIGSEDYSASLTIPTSAVSDQEFYVTAKPFVFGNQIVRPNGQVVQITHTIKVS